MITIAVLIMYVIATSGYTLYIHYCCGKVDKLSWAPVKQSACQHQNSMQNSACCADGLVHFDIDDSTPITPVALFNPVNYSVVENTTTALVQPLTAAVFHWLFTHNSSPPIPASRTILHCTFRI